MIYSFKDLYVDTGLDVNDGHNAVHCEVYELVMSKIYHPSLVYASSFSFSVLSFSLFQ